MPDAKQNKRGKELYYITHIDNLPSILEHGILSHNQIEAKQLAHRTSYNIEVVERRKSRYTPAGKSLWDYANLYFQPRNPMLYTVTDGGRDVNNHVILAIRFDVMNDPDIYITVGNAASNLSNMLPKGQGLRHLPRMQKDINLVWWSAEEGTKRRIMAECLVPDMIPADKINAVYVATHDVARRIEPILPDKFSIICEPNMFFKPLFETSLTDKLSLVKGDMFFSDAQTLTISVNTVGVMGRGLASRTKYQFPDAYVVYQDICRKNSRRRLKMGTPYLYKRETSSAVELAEEPSYLSYVNGGTWFIFFPTKDHWRQKGDLEGIKSGLEWIRNNYKREEIQSLAVPALGCGLGELQWADVGPLMCQALDIDIPVNIHMPLETDMEIPDDQLTRQYLLGR